MTFSTPASPEASEPAAVLGLSSEDNYFFKSGYGSQCSGFSARAHVYTHTHTHTHFQPRTEREAGVDLLQAHLAPAPSQWNVKALSVHALSISVQDLKPRRGVAGEAAVVLEAFRLVPVFCLPVSSLLRGSASLCVCDPLCSVPRPMPGRAGRDPTRWLWVASVRAHRARPPRSPRTRLKSRGNRSLSPCHSSRGTGPVGTCADPQGTLLAKMNPPRSAPLSDLAPAIAPRPSRRHVLRGAAGPGCSAAGPRPMLTQDRVDSPRFQDQLLLHTVI